MYKIYFRRKWIIVMVFVVSLAIVGFVFLRTSQEKDSQVTTKKKRLTTVIAQKLKRQDISEFLEISGSLIGISDVAVFSGVSGLVKNIHKSLGDWVEKGESIGDIDSDIKKSQYEQAQALYNVASSNMKATLQLYKSGQVSKSEYQNMVASTAASKANYQTSKMAYDYSKIIAPVSGFITDLPIEIGQGLSPQDFVCKIVDYKKLMIKTGVSDVEIKKIKEGQKVEVTSDGFEKIVVGKIVGVGRAPAYNNAVYPIEIMLERSDNLLPGMIVVGKISVKKYKNVFAVPFNSIVRKYDEQFVFGIKKGGIVEKIKVEITKIIGDMVLIKNGLTLGQPYVVEGIDYIEQGQEVKVNYLK